MKFGFSPPSNSSISSFSSSVSSDSSSFISSFSPSGLISSKNYGVKLLARGEIKTKIEVHVNAASNNVKNLVEKAGGKIIITENQTNEK